MFESYPKTRPPLPEAIQEVMRRHYRANREGATAASSVAQKMESWLHRQVAADVVNGPMQPRSTLEIGAGTLNQLQYEPHCGPYDVVEPSTDWYESSALRGRVRGFYSDISQVPPDNRYDRITSIATLEHLCDLPEVVARSGLLLTPQGTFRASIPSEGTPLWTLGWKLTTGLEFRLTHGLDRGLLMKHEHVNTADEIEEVLNYFFGGTECKVFGFSRSLSFYRFYACRGARQEKCRTYLRERNIIGA